MMESLDKTYIAELVKTGRTEKGYTQQDLADRTGISLRTVQRIENGEVLPRLYTLRLLEQHLAVKFSKETNGSEYPAKVKFPDQAIAGTLLLPADTEAKQMTDAQFREEKQIVNIPGEPANDPKNKAVRWSRPRKWILSASVCLLLLLLAAAFLSQCARFPETDFERLLFWSGVLVFYTIVLLKIWK